VAATRIRPHAREQQPLVIRIFLLDDVEDGIEYLQILQGRSDRAARDCGVICVKDAAQVLIAFGSEY
jgi:hypothetical protein